MGVCTVCAYMGVYIDKEDDGDSVMGSASVACMCVGGKGVEGTQSWVGE